MERFDLFGLVNIPVALYPVVKDRSISFKLVHEDSAPIKYKRWCPGTTA